jgi:hypothetical protein
VKAGARAVEGNTLEANPRRATGGHSKTSSDSAPGIKPLKGARDARMERTSREPQESRDRETGTDPAGGKSSERGSRHAVGRETSRRVVSDAKRSTDFGRRTTVQAGARAPRRAGASSSVARPHRTSGEPSRMDAIREEASGADSIVGPTGPRHRRLEERFQEASGAREPTEGIDSIPVGRAGSDSSETRTPANTPDDWACRARSEAGPDPVEARGTLNALKGTGVAHARLHILSAGSQSSFNHREKNPEVLSRLSHQAGAAKT